ncbi:MAG: hypothetical protein HOH74_10445 [Gemmatimonadetes bacterium]|jgi:hypothetical protein|nr:hypothetical protein [Gemmatimonadota bacterium]
MQRVAPLTWLMMVFAQLAVTAPMRAEATDSFRLDISGVAHTDFASRPQVAFPVPGEGFGSTPMENHLGMSVRLTRTLDVESGTGFFVEGTRLSGRSEDVYLNRDFSAEGGPARGQLQSSTNAYSFHLLVGWAGRKAAPNLKLPVFVQGSVAAGGGMGRLDQWTGVYDLDDAAAGAALVTRDFLTGTQFSYKFDTSIGLHVRGYDVQGGLYYVGADLIRNRFALNGMGLFLAIGSRLEG